MAHLLTGLDEQENGHENHESNSGLNYEDMYSDNDGGRNNITEESMLEVEPDNDEAAEGMKVPESEATPQGMRRLQEELKKQSQIRLRAEDQLKKSWETTKIHEKSRRLMATELEKSSSQGRRFYEIKDSYLKESFLELREDLHSFAIQYFGNNVSPETVGKLSKTDSYLSVYMPSSYVECLNAVGEASSLVEAFLWNVLRHKVLYQTLWAGDLREDFRRMRTCFQFKNRLSKEKERRRLEWLGTTSELILDALDEEKISSILKKELQAIIHKVLIAIKPLAIHVANAVLIEQLYKIFNKALKLDMVVFTQVARVEMEFGDRNWTSFDSTTMEVEQNGITPQANRKVLVVAPGIKKRTSCNGGDACKVISILPKVVKILRRHEVLASQPLLR